MGVVLWVRADGVSGGVGEGVMVWMSEWWCG